MRLYQMMVSIPLLTVIAGCVVGPTYQVPSPTSASQAVLPQFQANLPTTAKGTSDLVNWWAQFDDPLMAELVDTALTNNPTVAQALARVAQARAQASANGLYPKLNADASSSRSNNISIGQSIPSTYSTATFDATWELDLFGGIRKGNEAADDRYLARQADWHGSRVTLAAEVGTDLVNYRACVATAAVLAENVSSSQQTTQLTELKVKAGFTAPADGSLSNATTADAKQRLTQQLAECDLDIKALVELTDIAEPTLRSKLAANQRLPQPRDFTVTAIPAKALSQRPDIAAAERDLAASSANINVAEAKRYPSISLLGSIGVLGLHLDGTTQRSNAWSFGPTFTLPIMDGGQRKADVALAQATYDEAYAKYQAQVRGAVREIEGALVQLDANTRRENDAADSARDYERYFHANDDKFKAGSGSLLDLEEARRTSLIAQQTLIGIQRDRINAWIALYKALGGGWLSAADNDAKVQ